MNRSKNNEVQWVSKRVMSVAALAFGTMLAVVLTGCSAPAEPETERQAGWINIEACFTNELAGEPVTLKTLRDGSGVRWEGTVRPGATVCTQTKDTGSLFGEMSYAGDSSPYSFRFVNPNFGYPSGSIITGSRSSGKSFAPGVCKGFAALETGVLDSGSTRFTVQRLTDSDMKRFTVKIQPTQSTQIPTPDCLYQY